MPGGTNGRAWFSCFVDDGNNGAKTIRYERYMRLLQRCAKQCAPMPSDSMEMMGKTTDFLTPVRVDMSVPPDVHSVYGDLSFRENEF